MIFRDSYLILKQEITTAKKRHSLALKKRGKEKEKLETRIERKTIN